MRHAHEFYIGGAWVAPLSAGAAEVIDPSTETALGAVAMGSAADADRAVAAARAAFPAMAAASLAERRAMLERLLAAYNALYEEIAVATSREMGAPLAQARDAQAWCGRAHIEATIAALDEFPFEETRGATRVLREPAGVVAAITPWNWPLNQIASKVAPAIAAGCPIVLKPSEIAPFNALLFAEAVDRAGLPPGAFNLVNGDGPQVGQRLAAHPDVDVISFTGSTRAGIMVARTAADTVKRVLQELGGKSPNVLLDDADFAAAVPRGVDACFDNAGQSCNAPTRMLVPHDRMDEVLALAEAAAARQVVGDPADPATTMGPVSGARQFEKVQAMIARGVAEGAALVAGGPGRPPGLNRGFYVRPTVFGRVAPDMTVAREEIFGPVLAVIGYRDEEEAIRLANDTVYGLSAAVQSADPERARRVARRLRAGQVKINAAPWDATAPFGGYKQSGNGREYGAFGIHEFCEIKAAIGW
jgi:aldehyde dehydrogenase (NAD+)